MKFKAALLLVLHLWITASTNTLVYGSRNSGSGDSDSGNGPVMSMNDTDLLMPMNNSGGSGSGQPPVIGDCPGSIPTVTVVPQLGLFTVNISIMLNATDDNNLTVIFSAMNPMEGSNLITNTTIENDGSFLEITINGDNLNSIMMPTTVLNIMIVASDGFSDSEACIVTVSIEYLPPGECRVGRTAEEQTSSLVEQQFNAFYIPVQQRASQITLSVQMLIAEAVVTFLNSYCSQNCDQCSLSSNCGTLLRFCDEFTSDSVLFVDIREVPTVEPNDNVKRQLVSVTTTTQVVLAVTAPARIPITTSNGVPLIPPSTLVQVISDNRNTFESMTGLTVTGDPVIFFNPVPNTPIDFGKIAVIVLPIVVTLLVLAMVGGIATILLIVFVLKSKKKSKVLPVHSNGADLRQASQYSSIGKGHMNLEAVDDQ